MRVFNSSLVAIKDYLGSEARQELLAVFNQHFPSDKTAAKKTKFELFKIDKNKIKTYIEDAACATDAMPGYQLLRPSKEALIHWIRISHAIHNNIKVQSIAFFISCFCVSSVLNHINKINMKDVADILDWPVKRVYKFINDAGASNSWLLWWVLLVLPLWLQRLRQLISIKWLLTTRWPFCKH